MRNKEASQHGGYRRIVRRRYFGCTVPKSTIGEREIGAMLAEIEKNQGNRFRGGNTVLPPRDEPTLGDIGISKMQSSRYQQEARLPEKAFVQHIAQTKAAGEELTTAGVRVAESGHRVAVRRW